MNLNVPEWFSLSEEVTPLIMKSIADAASSSQMAFKFRNIPVLAHWFMMDSLLLANRANRDGMHANSLSLTRQCLEALSVIEVGICGHPDAELILAQWNEDKISAGKLRGWLQDNVWPKYGSGMWSEPWATFMREFAGALQPYAHYGAKLAQWQMRLLSGAMTENEEANRAAFIEMRPRAYDAQKATRITLFHAILSYTLGRICIARNKNDLELARLVTKLGKAIGSSRYLDGHATDWGQQFWAMLWDANGKTILE